MTAPDAITLFRTFMDRHLLPVDSFIGAVLVGSRVHDEHRANSDIDCYLIFEEVDERVVPREFVWIPSDDSFHSIFDVEAADVGGIQIDAVRTSWSAFSEDPWPEGLMHDLAKRRVVFERRHDIAGLIERRTDYPDYVRLDRLAKSTSWLDYYLTDWRLERWDDRAGEAGTHDQLDAAFDELLEGLHAYNRVWIPWRYRRLASALKLVWLPERFSDAVDELRTRGVDQRAATLSQLRRAMDERLHDDALQDAIAARQSRSFRGLGFASSMDEWREAHAEFLAEREP